MLEFSENATRQEKTPHEEFSFAFYSLLKNKMAEIFPNQFFNNGYLCNGDKKVSRISFSHDDGQALTESQWQLVKEHSCALFAEAMTSHMHEDELDNTNTSLSFSDADPEYNNDKTIIITQLDI